MYSCKSIPGATILDVLCSCQRLEVLYAGDISAKDIVKHGPWACEQLRELTIHIQVGESEQNLQWLAFGRLSTLERLEKLVMSSTSSYISSKGVLVFLLECGLGQLASLEQLRPLAFPQTRFSNGDHSPQLGIDEVEWMASNWRKLRTISGCLHKDE
jgi:hypothetical protein